MHFYGQIEKILTAADPLAKFEQFYSFYEAYKSGILRPESGDLPAPLVFSRPSFASFCTILAPKETPVRSGISSPEGRAALLHSFAHIEYNAFELALDAVYRFREVPEEFIKDWLEVADDEIRHFLEIRKVLSELETEYGDLPVHQYLFNISLKTTDLPDRMAVVPGHLEAVGLDVNPWISKKFRNMNDPQSERISKILNIILHDETDHVRKGLRWFRWSSDQRNQSSDCPINVIKRIIPESLPLKTPVNREARLMAGFSEKCLSLIEENQLKRL